MPSAESDCRCTTRPSWVPPDEMTPVNTHAPDHRARNVRPTRSERPIYCGVLVAASCWVMPVSWQYVLKSSPVYSPPLVSARCQVTYDCRTVWRLKWRIAVATRGLGPWCRAIDRGPFGKLMGDLAHVFVASTGRGFNRVHKVPINQW